MKEKHFWKRVVVIFCLLSLCISGLSKSEVYAATKKKISKTTITGIKDKTYNGKKITQSVVVKDGKKVLKLGKDYTLTYTNNKSVGTAKVTITGKGNYTSAVSKSFEIKPKKCSLSQVKQENNKIQLSWGKNASAGGYQVYIKQDKDEYKNLVTLNDMEILDYTVEGATEGIYYFKIRAFKKVKGKIYYGAFSNEVKISFKITKGTIEVPETTDSSMDAPKNIKLGETLENPAIKNDLTIMWDYDTNYLGSFYVAYYDSNDNLLSDYECSAMKNEGQCYIDIRYLQERINDYTIKTIVIAPVYYDENNNYKRNVGKAVVYNCNIEINVESKETLTAILKPVSWGQDNCNGINLPGTYEANNCYNYITNYKVKDSLTEKGYYMASMSLRDKVNEKGKIEIPCYTDDEQDGMTSTQRALDSNTGKRICIYSDLQIIDINQVSITANIHELNIVQE